jgi:hypothetical protein
MGNIASLCGGDPYQQIMKQYGSELMKFIVA